MRTFENAVVVHVKGNRRLPPRWIKRFVAFWADVFLGRDILSGGKPHDCAKDNDRNGNRPPRNVIMPIEPIDSAGGQRQGKNRYQKNESNSFHRFTSRLCRNIQAKARQFFRRGKRT